MKKKIFSFLMATMMMVSAVSVLAPTTVKAEEVATGRTVPHYTLQINGGDWDGTHYTMNGQVQKDVFFCDGTYTYYLQADGTPMKDRLTYHPDGEHVIYFDSDGHEVFSNFANVKKSISGDAVDDLCFFDTFGYMYVDKTTYDQSGQHLYYVNPYGVIERNGWFTYSNEHDRGYANADGTLKNDGWGCDQLGRQVYFQGDGTVARGIISDGQNDYVMDQTDGHYITQYPADQIGYNLGINNFPFPLGKLVTFTEEMANWLYERDEAVSGCKTVNRSNDDLIGKTGYFYINHETRTWSEIDAGKEYVGPPVVNGKNHRSLATIDYIAVEDQLNEYADSMGYKGSGICPVGDGSAHSPAGQDYRYAEGRIYFTYVCD